MTQPCIYIYKGTEFYYCPADVHCWGVADLMISKSWRPEKIQGHAPDTRERYTIDFSLEPLETKKIIKCRLCGAEKDYDTCTKKVIDDRQ
jgi:hypothetical protein